MQRSPAKLIILCIHICTISKMLFDIFNVS